MFTERKKGIGHLANSLIWLTFINFDMVEAAGVEPKADLTAIRLNANLPNDYRMN